MTTTFKLDDGDDLKPNLAAIEQQVLELIDAENLAASKVEKTLIDQVIGFISTSFDLIRSILIRIIFGVHLLVAIGMVCYVREDSWYFVNSVGVVFIVIEWFVTAFKNGGKDLPWFSPSFFLYIATIIPPTWFLELENIRYKIQALEQIRNASAMASTSTQFMMTTTTSRGILTRMRNSTAELNITLVDYYEDSPIESMPIPLPIPKLPGEIKSILKEASRNFAMYIEVTMMLIIILGRWIMPKEGITRNELSQLLLVYMSLASDIIDLLSVLAEDKIMVSTPMVYATLTIYSWSLFQFTLNLVVTRGRSSGANTGSAASLAQSDNSTVTGGSGKGKKKSGGNASTQNELWNVMITLMMQDFPFFILRTVCVFKFGVASYLFLFFTFKNGILFSLQIYRIVAIFTDKEAAKAEEAAAAAAAAANAASGANLNEEYLQKLRNTLAAGDEDKNVIS